MGQLALSPIQGTLFLGNSTATASRFELETPYIWFRTSEFVVLSTEPQQLLYMNEFIKYEFINN